MNARLAFLIAATALLGPRAEAALPADYTPMKIIQTEAPIYPRRVVDIGIAKGDVHVSVQIDENGKLTDYLVTAYTHPAFADSAVAALKKWDYEPAYIRGRPHGATVDLTFSYEQHGIVVVDMTVSSYVEMRNLQMRPSAYAFRACTLRQLDRIPTPTKVVQPLYPVEASKAPQAAKVTVLFFIDEQGRVRLPAVSRETNDAYPAFAAAALEAVSQWQFEPPLSKGQHVLVAARQEFSFRPDNAIGSK